MSAGLVGLGVGKLMVSLLNHDSNILKDGKQIDALLKDEKSVKGKKNQEIVKRLIMADAPDEVKLNALIDAFGNAKGGKLNTRELVGALGQVMAYKNLNHQNLRFLQLHHQNHQNQQLQKLKFGISMATTL